MNLEKLESDVASLDGAICTLISLFMPVDAIKNIENCYRQGAKLSTDEDGAINFNPVNRRGAEVMLLAADVFKRAAHIRMISEARAGEAASSSAIQ